MAIVTKTDLIIHTHTHGFYELWYMILPVYHVNLCNKQTNHPCFLCSLAFLKSFCIYLLYCGKWSFATTATAWRSGDKFRWSGPSFHCVESREEMQVTRLSSTHLYPSEQRLAWLFYVRCYQWQPKRIFSLPFPSTDPTLLLLYDLFKHSLCWLSQPLDK